MINLVRKVFKIIYFLKIRGQEGRAGMAAILDPDNSLDLTHLAKEITKVLPSYARPIFIRILRKMDMTGLLFLLFTINMNC